MNDNIPYRSSEIKRLSDCQQRSFTGTTMPLSPDRLYIVQASKSLFAGCIQAVGAKKLEWQNKLDALQKNAVFGKALKDGLANPSGFQGFLVCFATLEKNSPGLGCL